MTKKICLAFILSFTLFSIKAQTEATQKNINVASVNDSLFLTDCLLLVDSTMALTPGETLEKHWQTLSSFKLKNYAPTGWINKKIYLQLHLENTDTSPRLVYFFPGISFRSIKTFKIFPDKTYQQLEDLSKSDGYQPITIQANEKQQLLVELSLTKTVYNYILPQLIAGVYIKKYQKIQYHRNEAHIITGYLLSGILLMMLFFSMANFMLSRKPEFLLNGCYTACMFLLFFLSTFFDKKSGVAASIYLSFGSFFLLVVGTLSYIAFTRKFLDTATNFPRLDKLFLVEQIIFLLILAAFTWLNFFSTHYKLQSFLENFMKITALLVGIVYIITALIQKNKLLNYLAAGNVMLILFSIISFYFMLVPLHNKGVFSFSILYYELGIVSEIIFFMLGLTYKNRIEIIEKIKEQEAFKMDAERQSYETKLAVLNAQQQERNRISADMHDDLGAGITAIRLYSELAKGKLTDAGSVTEIERISDSANELLNNMNAIIWTMSSSNDSLADMVSYIRSYAQEYFESTNIHCKIIIPETLPDIIVSGQIRRNVFLVIKEALSNVVKHSHATNVSITLLTEPSGISLFIQDDGTGIDLNSVRRFGNGLKNMKRRMNEMGIDFLIEKNNGTLITLHYNLLMV